jgi:predicted membrane-bound spermidine synthase
MEYLGIIKESTRNNKILTWVFYFLFALSGGAGLIYEVVWVRQFTQTLGASSFAVTIILATFMGGLGLGAWLIGKKADRLGVKSLITTYALLEIGIGIYSLLLPALLDWCEGIYVVFHQSLSPGILFFNGFRLLLAALLLILPTTLIGATLPILSRYLIRHQDHIAVPVSRLYAMNALGGFFGTVLAGYFLLPNLGIQLSTGVAVGLNFLVAGVFWLINFRLHTVASSEMRSQVITEARDPGLRPEQKAVLTGCFLSGIAAMFYEVAWTRTLSMILGTTTFAFSTMLATFLLGIALGSVLYSRIKHFVSGTQLVIVLQFLVALTVLLSIPLFEKLPMLFVLLHERFVSSWLDMQLIRFTLAGSVMLLPTIAMGILFPAVSEVFIDSTGHLGRRIGKAYGLNTFGNVLGAVLCGLAFLPLIGMQKAIMAGALLNLVAGCLILLKRRDLSRYRRCQGLALASLSLIFTILLIEPWSPRIMNSGVYVYAPRYEKMLDRYDRAAKYHDTIPEASPWMLLQSSMEQQNILFFETGPTATVAVMESQDGTRFLTVDGKTDASTGKKSDMQTQVMIGQLPMLYHPNPDKILVVGMGSGVTAGSVLTHNPRVVDCAELSPAVIEAAEYFSRFNHQVLDDPRLKIIPRDARNLLLTSQERYDVIISQPSNPWISGQSSLFSLEWYRLVKQHLKPGGIFLQWAPSYLTSTKSLKIIVHTMQSVFPHLSAWSSGSIGDMIFLAKKGSKLRVDYKKFLDRIQNQEVITDIQRVGLQPEFLPFDLFVMGEEELSVYLYSDLYKPLPKNTDNLLYTEFSMPKQLIRRNRISNFVEPDQLHGKIGSLLRILKNVDLENLVFDKGNLSAQSNLES